MPRKAMVSVEDAIGVIEKFFDHFQDGQYPNWSSDIWKQMSRALDNKWSCDNVYNNVTKNRRKIMETSCANKNVPFIPFKGSRDKSTLDESMLNNSTTLNDNDDSLYNYEEETAGLDDFEVRITSKEWKEMREPDIVYNDNRKYPMLHRNVWTDKLALAIDRQLELPCAFIFNKSKLYETPESLHYMRITGICMSKECGNPLFCYIYEEPGDHDFNISVRTRDTFYDKHEKVERPLRGVRRQKVGEEVFNEGSANWRKRQIVANTRFGGRIPSHIPNLNVLNQAKKEHVDRKLGVKSSDAKDLVKTIEEMKHSAPYHGFIHEIKRDKFYVAFSTPAQLHAYKQYCRTTKKFSSVSIDGTGSIVKPLIREDGSPSGHIFLYSVTINLNNTTLSVYDMLTESQDTDAIWWWLKHWQKLGAPKPREVVCDQSRALMNGISMASNYQTVKAYNETCFLYASGNSEYPHRSPIYTYLRLDVAHLMITVRKWKCFEHMRHAVVRQFYQYCVGLMIDCQTLEHFREIFLLTCIVGVNEFQDSIIKSTGHSVLSAPKKLEALIANRNFDLNFENSTGCDNNGNTDEQSEEDDSMDTSRIKKWISNLRQIAEVKEHTGSEPNSFYFIDFIDRFMLLAYEFPLWTPVAIPYVAEHGLTAFVEGHFNIIKHGTLKNYSGLLRVDKFLKLIFEDYSGSAALVTSKWKVFNQNEGPHPGPLTKPNIFLPREDTTYTKDTNEVFEQHFQDSSSSPPTKIVKSITEVTLETHYTENKDEVDNQPKVETRKAKGKYFKPNPNIQHRNTLAANIQKSWLLQNGNLVTKPARIDGSYYFVCNTCGPDSIAQILAASAMDDPEYMTSIQKSTNETLQFIVNFIQKGPCAAVYKERIVLLKHFFDWKTSANYRQCSQLTSYSIDLFDNINTIWSKCFDSEPSAWDIHECPRCDIYASSVATLSINHKIIGEQGFGALQEALVFHSKSSCINENCTELCQVKRTYNTQIFIELDVRPSLEFSTGMSCKLCNFPVYLNINRYQYRLAGVIARLPGHYVAYCRRINNCWEMCNDTRSRIVHCLPNSTIEPHGVVYIASIDQKKPHGNLSLDFSEQDLSPFKIPTSTNSCETRNEGTLGIDDNYKEIPRKKRPLLPARYNRSKFSTTVPLDDSDTTTRDNWRNKEEIRNICFETSLDRTADDNSISEDKTMEPIHSDISYEGEQVLVLQTGNVMPGIIIDEEICHLRDTQNFDSIVHVLRCSALDEPVYMASMKKSANETLRFTLEWVEGKSHQDIYSKRAVLLKSLYSSRIVKEVENDIGQYTIDLREKLTDTWGTCLGNEPSVLKEYKCKSCKTYISPMPVLTVDHNLVVRKGFTALEEALHFYKTLKKVKCQQEHCHDLCTVTAYPNFHIYIELEITNNDLARTRLRCKLQDFPKTLSLKGQSGRYRLKGIVAQTSDYIASYCLRADNQWELYDSYSTMTSNCNPTEAIEPYGAIYVVTA